MERKAIAVQASRTGRAFFTPPWFNPSAQRFSKKIVNVRIDWPNPATELSPYPQTTEVWFGSSQSRDHSFPPGILIADPDPSIRMVAALRKRGFAVWLAADGEEALDMYGLHQDAINVVLLNVHLPRLDGIETAEVLLDFDPNVACCFMGDDSGEYRTEDPDVLAPVRAVEKSFKLIETVEALWQLACDHQVMNVIR